jgi:lysozyme family protein
MMPWLDWLKRPAPAVESLPAEPADAFPSAFAWTVGEEGGFTDDPRDSGNWTAGKVNAGECRGTKYGISAAAHPDVDIAALTVDGARAIYREQYWDANRLGELPDRIGAAVFDGAVNSGARPAIAWLQKALGQPDTGVVDDQTIAAARAATDPSGVLMRYWGQRLKFLADLSTFPAFGRGWSRRVARGLLS